MHRREVQWYCDDSRVESGMMQTHTIYANLSETVTFVCEQCHRSKVFKATAVQNLPQPFKIRCSCGATFEVSIVIRPFYRKKTRLPGTYVKHDVETEQILEQGRIIIEDISHTGIGFRTVLRHTIQVNDVLSLAFTLDDRQKTDIQKVVRVRRIDHRFIGAEFVDHDAYTDTNRMIGFYLRPH